MVVGSPAKRTLRGYRTLLPQNNAGRVFVPTLFSGCLITLFSNFSRIGILVSRLCPRSTSKPRGWLLGSTISSASNACSFLDKQHPDIYIGGAKIYQVFGWPWYAEAAKAIFSAVLPNDCRNSDPHDDIWKLSGYLRPVFRTGVIEV